MDCSDGNVAVNEMASATHRSGGDVLFAALTSWLLRPTPASASAPAPASASASAPTPGSPTLLGTVSILATATTPPLPFPALKPPLNSFATRLLSLAVAAAARCELTATC